MWAWIVADVGFAILWFYAGFNVLVTWGLSRRETTRLTLVHGLITLVLILAIAWAAA